MKLIIGTTIALAALSACAKPNTLVCDREAIAWDKWGEPSEIAENCLPSPIAPIAPLATPVAFENDDNRTPETPNRPDRPDRPDTPDTPDRPDTPDTPDKPDTPDRPDTPDKPDHPDRPENPRGPQGNNGWGNGDQTAPGRSIDRNQAENERGNPGHRSGKPQNSN